MNSSSRLRTSSTVCFLINIVLLMAIVISASAQSVTPVFPGATWATKTAAEVGMNSTALTTFSNYMGGRGCVVRYGYVVHTWGTQSTRADIASACKPYFTHFLFQALEDGAIPSLDQTVNNWQSALNPLNPSLGYKDRSITWRHMANQMSCYGVSEWPGTAFCYNDYQMALFFDTLFLNVYGATWSNVDANVFHPMLTDVMQCQDNPTFMIFGTGDRPGRTGVSVRDHARFGLLYLNEGNWNGNQLISTQHAREIANSSLSNSIPQSAGVAAQMISGQRSIGSTTIPDNQGDHLGSYSWLWWTNGVDRTGVRSWPNAPMDAFGAMGHGGKRCCVVIPSLGIVVAWNDANNIDTIPEQAEALRLLTLAVNGGPQPMPRQIIVDPAHPQWFARQDAGPYFLCGPGDPEDFLYRGTRNSSGTRNGDQMTLINKIKGTGANSIYLQAVRSHGGDGDSTHNPFINSDPTQGLDQDILNQWEDWFAKMDKNNITIFLLFYGDSARIWTGDTVGSAERTFIQGIVNRFEHHRNLIWCVAEEYAEAYSAARVANIAAEIRAADMHKHPIGVHKNTGLDFSEFADNTNIDQFTIQYNVPTAGELHTGMVSAWNTSNGRYNLNMSECADHGTGATARLKNWATAMGGAYVMVLGMDIASTSVSDLQDCGRLVTFFESTKFNEMAPRDDLAYGGTQYLLANPGSSYIAYASNLSGSIGVKSMTAGLYTFQWFDCANGATVVQNDVNVQAGDRTFAKPGGIGNELAVYINRTGDDPGPYCFRDTMSYSDGALNGNGGWNGSATASQIEVVNDIVRLWGGSGSYDAIRTVYCGDPGTGYITVTAKLYAGTGARTIWNLWIDDTSGKNLARWYGTANTARGRIGDTSSVTNEYSLVPSAWNTLVVKIYPASNTSQFFFNGASIGTLSHASEGAGDIAGRLRLERIGNSEAVGHFLYFDDFSIGEEGPDVDPPASVTNFVATPGNTQNVLTWTNPTSDFTGTMIRFKTTGFPTSVTDGTQIYDSNGTSFTHTGLTNGVQYYYAAYAHDAVPNYAAAATASATPVAPPAYCFQDLFSYANGALVGQGGWTGNATASHIEVTGGYVRIWGGKTDYYAQKTVNCGAQGGYIWVRINVNGETGSDTMWSLRINDSAGKNLARWYGSGTTARGRIGDTSLVTTVQNLSGAWQELAVKIDPLANTSEFFFAGTSIGTLSHSSTGAGDVVQQIKMERINNNNATTQHLYFDDLRVGG